MRLDKYLAETAQCTRSEAKTLLSRGRVTVNSAACFERKGGSFLGEAGAALDYQTLVFPERERMCAAKS